MIKLLSAIAFIAAFIVGWSAAEGHDSWANGYPIPEWVKTKCCHANEARDLTLENGITAADVEIVTKRYSPGGGEHGDPRETFEQEVYTIKGMRPVVSKQSVFPSQDGHIWAFTNGGVTADKAASFWCLFIPCAPKNDAAPDDFGGLCG